MLRWQVGNPTPLAPLQALLDWARAVCAPHGVPVDNLTWALADGRVLCLLVRRPLPLLKIMTGWLAFVVGQTPPGHAPFIKRACLLDLHAVPFY